MKKKSKSPLSHLGIRGKAIVRTMKLTTLFFLLSLVQIHATTYSQNTMLNISVQDKTIKDVFQEIEDQSEFHFLYNDEFSELEKSVDVNVSETRVESVLDEVFEGMDITYKVLENNLIVITPLETSMQQSDIIRGKISDADSEETLIGVNVVEKGTTNGTISDFDGNFTLQLTTENPVLIFSFIGYNKQEIVVGNKKEIKVFLEASTIGIEEVVAIGYGSMKKSDLTGAISSISADDLAKSSDISIAQAMQGKATGVSVTANTGSPGDAPTVRIRGIGTVGNSDPLYIVDGVPVMNIVNINMNDVESMEVLKDASSTAIYGSRGANGVILIKTKSGKKGKAKVSYDGSMGVQSAWRYMDVCNAEQYATLRNEARDNDNLEALPELADPSSLKSYDWGKLAYRDGVVQNHQVSVTGGSDEVNYYLSFNYTNQEGIIKGTDYERYSVRVNNDYKLNDNIKVGHNVAYVSSTRNTQPEYGSWPWDRLSMLGYVWEPTVPFLDENGDYTVSQYQSSKHPLATIKYNGTEWKEREVIGNFFADYDFLDHFHFKTNYSIDVRNRDRDQFTPSYMISSHQQNPINSMLVRREKTIATTWTNLLTYKQTFNEKHNVDALLGHEIQESEYDFVEAGRSDIPSSISQPTLSSGTSDQSNSGNYVDTKLISYFTRLNYNFDNRYLLTVNFRCDGSPRFGPNTRWGSFPSVATGWNVHNEEFFDSELISQLKVRGGYGEIGNQNIGNYAYFATLSTGQDVTFGTEENKHAGIAPTTLGNDDLQWETTKTASFGIDLGLWNNSLTFTADYYRKNTTDMLLHLPLPAYVGVKTGPWVNAGEIENKGYEFTANYHGQYGEFKYDIGANISFIDNKVLDLGTAGNFIDTGVFGSYPAISHTEEGRSLAEFYGYEMIGIFQNATEVDGYPHLNGTVPGDVKYKDQLTVDTNGDGIADAGDGVIDSNDRTSIGSPLPDFTYGINLSATYRDFDLSAFFQGSHGNDIYSTLPFFFEGQTYSNMTTKMFGRWHGEGTSNTIPRLTETQFENNIQPSSSFVFDGSYLRLKNIQLGYTLPSELTRKIDVNKLRIYVSAQNLFTITSYDEGMDPEIGIDPTVSGTNRGLELGIDRGIYPQARTIMMGLNLTF